MAMPSWTKDFTRELMSGSFEEVAAKIKTAVASSDLPATALRGIDRVLTEVKKNAQQVRRWTQRNASLEHSALNASGTLFQAGLVCPPQYDEQWQAGIVGSDLFESELCGQRKRIERQLQSTVSQATGLHCLVARSTAAAAAAIAWSLDGSSTLLAPRCLDYRPDSGGPIQDYFASANTKVFEVGTASGCTDDDWERALQSCRTDTFALELALPTTHQLRSSQLPERLRSGACQQIQFVPFGCLRVPCDLLTDASSLLDSSTLKGNWLTIVPTDCMIGGPRGALILGPDDALATLSAASAWPAFEAALGTVAAITATLQQPDPGTLWISRLTEASIENLQNRAERMATQLACIDTIADCEIASQPARIDTSLQLEIPSRQLRLRSTEKAAESWAAELRSDAPALIVSTDNDHLVVDMRWLPAKHDGLAGNLLSGKLAGGGGED